MTYHVDLTVDPLMIETIDGFLSPTQCAAWIAWGESRGFGDAPISGATGPVMMKSIRNNDRVMADEPNMAATLFDKLAPLLPDDPPNARAIGLNERLRMYRYRPGQKFALHRDGYYRRSRHECSLWTFLVYLNDDFEGGQTRFATREIVPCTGIALLFQHDLMHEGAEVTQGTKYVLRSDVMFALQR